MTNEEIMTNEEAIKILESKMDGSVDTSYEWAEAVRMAIEALKVPTGFISKQDVKWQIQEWINELNEAIDMLDSIPSADRPKNMIHIDEVYRLIAGHSNYHGDSILSAFTCLVEGKDVKPIAPLDESAEPKTKWIPVSEKPKDEKRTYLVQFDGGGMCSCRWTNANPIWTELTTDWHWNIFDIPQYCKVVAWMDLEPYREDGEV